MRLNIAILFVLCLSCRVWSDSVVQLLREFQREMVHYPGNHTLQTPAQTLGRGGGTDQELAEAFRAVLDGAGYENRLVRGHVSMTSLQLAQWGADLETVLELGGMADESGNWRIPMTWLQCRTNYYPGMQGSGTEGQNWLHVFPGLVGAERLVGRWLEVESGRVASVLDLLKTAEMTSENGRLENLGDFCKAVCELVKACHDSQALFGASAEHLAGSGMLPGYQSERILNLNPVKVLDYTICGASSSAVLNLEISSGGTVLLDEDILWRELEQGLIEVSWTDKGTGENALSEAVANANVLGKRVRCRLERDNMVNESNGDILIGLPVVVRFSLEIDGATVERIEDRCLAGDQVVYGISNGYLGSWDSGYGPVDGLRSLCCNLRYRLDRFGRLSGLYLGEHSREKLKVCRAGLCPRGKMVHGGLAVIERHELLAGACGTASGSRNLSLTMLLGQNAVTMHCIRQSCQGKIESPLTLFWQEIHGKCEIQCESKVDGGDGIHCVNVPLWLDWQRGVGPYSGKWEDSDGQGHDLSMVRVTGVTALEDNTMTFQDNSWLTVLSVVRQAVSEGIWKRENVAGEVFLGSIFACIGERLMAQPRLTNWLTEIQRNDGVCRPVLHTSFQGERIGEWRFVLSDSAGRTVFTESGNGDAAECCWDGCDADGRVCEDGVYELMLMMMSGESVCSEKRKIIWDGHDPEISLHGYTVTKNGQKQVCVEYNVLDFSRTSLRLELIDGNTRVSLAEYESELSSGRVYWIVTEEMGDSCMVSAEAVDNTGNRGGHSVPVILESVYVGGTVWNPDGESEDYPEDTGIMAEITSMTEGQCITEGVFDVLGTVKTDKDESQPKYQLRLRDGNERLLACRAQGEVGNWKVHYHASEETEENLEVLYPSCAGTVKEGLLATVDLSALPNGKYTMELIALCDGKASVCRRAFMLDSSLKIGQVDYVENDGVLHLPGLDINLQRRYSSLGKNGSYGYGWTTVLDAFEVQLDESRNDRSSLTGERVSVRNGGSRDVTLTLPDGHRVTFVFSLTGGGGFSYSYYGAWTAPSGCGWRLESTVSSDVTALPGLEPYWKSAGMGIPLENYDFPGFVLTSPDGTRYVFERELLGEYIAAGDDGGEIMMDCHGKLRLGAVEFTGQRRLVFENDNLLWHEADGTTVPALKTVKDSEGRIVRTVFQDESGTVLEFTYSPDGNLLTFSRGTEGETPMLRRCYYYENQLFPHLLTRVCNAGGRPLISYVFDDTGNLARVENGTGGHVSLVHDPFSRTEILCDEAGNETLYRYDGGGNIVEQVFPDGGIMRYSYDSEGRCLSKVDPLGRKTSWAYDGAGHLVQRTDPNGGVTLYDYDGTGTCYRMTDVTGKSMMRLQTADGSEHELTMFSGKKLNISCDSDGRPVRMALNKGESIDFDYDEVRRCVTISDGKGQEVTREEMTDGNVTRMVSSWLEDGIQEPMQLTTEVTHNGDGSLRYIHDSMGNWREITRNSDGWVTEERRSTGKCMRMRYNLRGLCVEKRDEAGRISRMIYDTGGKLLLTAGPEEFSLPEEQTGGTLIFEHGKRMGYDSCGRMVSSRYLGGVIIGLRDLGGGYWECTLESEGTELGEECWEYDLAGQLSAHYTVDGHCERYSYDVMGRLVESEDSNGSHTQLVRDSAGRVLSMTDGNGAKTEWSYDCSGEIANITDSDGRSISYKRLPGGELIEKNVDGYAPVSISRSAAGEVTGASQGELKLALEYSPQGALLSADAGGGRRIVYQRDSLGRIIEVSTAEGRGVFFDYDSILGEQWRCRGKDGNGVEIQKGENGEWKIQRYFNGENIQFEIERLTEELSCLRQNGVEMRREEWKRNATLMPSSHWVDGVKVAHYDYDLENRIKGFSGLGTQYSMHYVSGREAYRDYGMLGGRNVQEPLRIAMDYDCCGRPKQEWMSNGFQKVTDYDSVGRIRAVEYWKDGRSCVRQEYSFDEGGRKSQLDETIHQGQEIWKRRVEWSYDDMGRLIGERHESETGMEVDYQWDGCYDPYGNLVEERIIRTEGEELRLHEYDRDGCLICSERTGTLGTCRISYEWDANGQLASETCSGTENWKTVYEWTGVGILKAVSKTAGDNSWTVTFLYDVGGLLCGHVLEEKFGKLVTVTEHSFIYDSIAGGAYPQISEYQIRRNGGEWQHVSVIRGNDLLGVSGPECSMILYGGHGQRIGTVTEDGQLIEEQADGWGQALNPAGMQSGLGPFGEWLEARTGLVYLRQRFYSPRLKRFISPDMVLGSIEEPQSFHRYVYCMNDPVNRTDPAGTFSTLSMVSAMACMEISVAQLGYQLISVTNDWCYHDLVSNIFTRMKKEHDNATVFVHGMAWHEDGWSQDMQSRLKGAWRVTNQDMYEFLWSGFAATENLFLPIPNFLNHSIALWSFLDAMSIVHLKGYSKVNVISHSWGTMITRDGLTLSLHPVSHWVTMGSPLCCFIPGFRYDGWHNYVNVFDPVTQASRILFDLGYNHCEHPLTQQLWPVQQMKIRDLWDLHSTYWTHFDVLSDIASFLRQQ